MTSRESKPRPVLPAPDVVKLLVCEKCGKTDRYAPLSRRGKHYAAGSLCNGQVYVVEYRRAES